MIVSIHQPNYLPWAGYFYKISNSDVFVFLDCVYSSKISYVKRTLFKTAKNERYLTVPVGKKNIPINQILLPKDSAWKAKHLNFLQEILRNTPFFDIYYSDLKQFYMDNNAKLLSEFNINLVKYLLNKMQIETKIYVESEIEYKPGGRNERLINICKKFNANLYLSGNGAKEYNDEELFSEHNVKIMYSKYSPKSDLTKYSILYHIFLNGYEKVKNWLIEKNIK